MPEGTIMKYDMMYKAEWKGTEPNGLLGMKTDLKLTDEQVKKLQDINDKAMKDAKAVLTPDQVTMVEKMSGPDTMVGMQQEMMSKGAMRGGRGGAGGGGGRPE